MSMLLLSMLGAVAEFERSLIEERQREGIAIAKAKGIYKGRKPSLTPDQAEDLRRRLEIGHPDRIGDRAAGSMVFVLRPANGASLVRPHRVQDPALGMVINVRLVLRS